MSIDLKTISELREKTGAGLNDCKSALEEAGGDIDQALELMRKKGELKAAKKADRAVKEGVISVAIKDGKYAFTALACETDFVSRGADFQSVATELSQKLLESTTEDFKSWSEEKIKGLVLKIGENIQLTDYGIFEGAIVGTYIHSNKKVAGVCVLSGGSEEVANDIAMQIAAMSPRWLNPESVESAIVEKEKEIYREQLKGEGKPEQIWDKIIEGKLNKFYEENCLTNQIFIKDDSKKIKDLLADNTVTSWKKFQV